MRIPKKIRGQRKFYKKIERWKQENLKLDIERVKKINYEYVKIWVQPFDNIRYHDRDYIGPKTGYRIQLIQSLIEIYDNWKIQLDQLNIPYYLKVWWYEPRINSSQVVCAIGDKIDYYNSIFEPIENKIPINRYYSIANKLSEFKWYSVIDEEIIENDFWPKEGFENKSEYFKRQRYFRKLESLQIKKKETLEFDRKSILYFVPKGVIHLGSRR